MLRGNMRLALLTILVTLFFSPCFAQESKTNCRDWQSRVDSKKPFVFKNTDNGTQEEIYEAIDCLLKLKGKKQGSNVSGAIRGEVSQIFPEPTSVEVAALYFITYLFYQRWDYADASYLIDKKFKLNTPKSVNEAYKAYKIWFRKMKEIGLEEARKQNLDPLANSTVSWYGLD